MDKITEIIPDDMLEKAPEWAKKAFDEGQFFRIALSRINDFESALKEIHKIIEGNEGQIDAVWEIFDKVQVQCEEALSNKKSRKF